jgi:hypothetical protein
MTALLIALFAALRCTARSRLELEAEILALRHQLAVLQRQAPRRPHPEFFPVPMEFLVGTAAAHSA